MFQEDPWGITGVSEASVAIQEAAGGFRGISRRSQGHFKGSQEIARRSEERFKGVSKAFLGASGVSGAFMGALRARQVN